MVIYEWDVETVAAADSEEHEAGECLDHHHVDSFKSAILIASADPDPSQAFQIVLVRDDDYGRSWAYLDDAGLLPQHFEDAYSHCVARVPQRFVNEVARVRK